MRSLKSLIVMFAALALVLAGCGDDDDEAVVDTTSTTAATPTSAGEETATTMAGPPVSIEGDVNEQGTGSVENGEIEIELDDFYFEPTYIEAAAGEEFTATLHNEGSAAHTFTIDTYDIDEVVEPGAETTVTVTVTVPEDEDEDTLVFYCRFHQAQGMQGGFFTAGS